MLRAWKLEIVLDAQSDKALYLQTTDTVISDIRSGRLKPGEALPGSRSMAQLLKVNRNTVVEALGVLVIEGWLVSKERQGTFVADTFQVFAERSLNWKAEVVKDDAAVAVRLQFDDGHPDSKIAPINELARAYRQLFGQKGRWQLMGYGDELGDPEFRKTIVQMLNYQRGMQVNEEHICITRGSQMAMYLMAQCFFTAGDCVMVENPGYKPAWKAFEKAGAELLPVNVDAEGLVVDEVEEYLKSGRKIKALYVTPHRQYPTTVTLSLQRRLRLIALSNKYGFTVIEDDYDNEFHFGYRSILPLSSFCELQNYVYIGTMSKVVAPALRIGYLACTCNSLIGKVGELRKMIDVQGDSIMEQAVLQLIKDGTVKRHIKKAMANYKTKRDYTAALLQKYMKDKALFTIPDGGLAFWIVPNKKPDWFELSEKMKQKGIGITTPDSYSFNETINGIRLGYGSLPEKDLKEGIVVLVRLL